MSLTKLNENLNNHQSLPDQPSLTSQELKVLFDKAGNDIKTYLNTILTAEIDALISNIQSGKIDVNKIVNNLTTGGANNVASAETVKQLNNNKLDASANAVSASKLQNSRTISLSGAVSGSVDFDGGENVNINTTQSNIVVLNSTNINKNGYGVYIANFNFPNGFNKQNCVPIAVGFKSGHWRYFGVDGRKSLSVTFWDSGSQQITAFFGEDMEGNPNQCRVVLMKIS